MDSRLASAPYTIALLGHLMLLTTENDFTLEENVPRGGFRYLKYPNSFRVSLVQLTNVGWEAFNAAHVNMDSIRLHTTNMDSYVKKLVNIMTKGTVDEIKFFIPKNLQKIQRIADDCVTLSIKVEDRFQYFMDISAELLEVSTMTQGVHEEKSKDAEMAIEAAKKEKQNAEEENDRLENQYDLNKKEIQNAVDGLKESLKSMPSTTTLVGLKLLDSIGGIVKALLKIPDTNTVEQFQRSHKTESEEDRARKRACRFANEIESTIQSLVDIATSGNEKSHKEPDWSKLDIVRTTKHSLLIIIGNIKRDDRITNVHHDGMQICQEAVRLCEQLLKLSKEMTPQKNSINKLIMDAEDNLLTSQTFSSDCTAAFASSGSWTWSSSTSSSSLVHNELKKAQMNVDVQKNILNDARRKQEEIIRSIKENSRRMEETLNELASIKIKNVDFNTIRTILVKGLSTIQHIRRDWGNVIRFFQTISSLIKLQLHSHVTELVGIADFGSNENVKYDKVPDMTRQLFSQEVFHVSTMVYAINRISSTYVEISEKYLIDDINSLPGLIALNPKTEQKEIEQKRNDLVESCKNAQREISTIIMKKREQCKADMDEKIRLIEGERP